MDTQDPQELAEAATYPFKTYCALLVSVLALVLALNNLGGSNTGKEATMNNILAANTYSFYQAKSVRQTEYKLAADRIELQLATEKPSPAAKELLEKKLADYQKTIKRYDSDPENGEGKKELLAKAKQLEADRDLALRKDPWFDYAEGLLQLAIVLTSVAIITDRRSMFNAALLLGAVGSLCTLNGYFLFY
ncbi:MAG: hypothetical protein RI998_341 [Pseudomonadota bacterium]|jgi:hypothetical protein